MEASKENPFSKFIVVILGYVWPEPISSAAGVRTWGLVNALLSHGVKTIHFLSPAKDNKFAEDLRNKNIATHVISANDPEFDTLIRNLNPTHVIFDRFVLEEQFGWRVREQCPEAVRIVDTQDLHFLRKAREMAIQKNSPVDLQTTDSYREIASIYRSDCSLILSNFELDLLMKTFRVPEELLHLTRFFYPAPQELSKIDRKHFIFLGNYRHPPNHDGVRWLCAEIWPMIRAKLPHAELHLYGAYPPKEIAALHSPHSGVIFLGQAENQYATLAQYRVNLAPLRFGAGIKGKIADGWFSGTPCISTSIGGEGMGYDESKTWGGLVANSPNEFAEAAVRLYENDSLWKTLQTRGYQLMEELFSNEQNSANFMALLKHLEEKKNQVRSNNFIGRMLWHHTLQSTKYLSRWIEEKNKKAQAVSPLEPKPPKD